MSGINSCVFEFCYVIYQFVRITGRYGAFRILVFDSFNISFLLHSLHYITLHFLCWPPQPRPLFFGFPLWSVIMMGCWMR
jgi:hypothetical protein